MEPIYGMNILEAAKNGVQFENGFLLVIQHLAVQGWSHSEKWKPKAPKGFSRLCTH
jgi:hypothetical protein